MTELPAPFRLDEGIWLEDLDLVVPWDTKINDLRQFGLPEVQHQPTSLHLSWKNHVCLGFSSDVSACRVFEPPNPRAYHIYLETFHCASLKWESGLSEWSLDEITSTFKSAYEHLRRHLGEAAFSYPPYSYAVGHRVDGCLPSIFWRLPALTIGLDATFPRRASDTSVVPNYAAQFRVIVAHEPPGYAELKAETRAIEARERDGAVDYVAW